MSVHQHSHFKRSPTVTIKLNSYLFRVYVSQRNSPTCSNGDTLKDSHLFCLQQWEDTDSLGDSPEKAVNEMEVTEGMDFFAFKASEMPAV